jgi:hypothetical protein
MLKHFTEKKLRRLPAPKVCNTVNVCAGAAVVNSSITAISDIVTFHFIREFPYGFQPTTRAGVFRDSHPAPPVCKNFSQSIPVIFWQRSVSLPLLAASAHFTRMRRHLFRALFYAIAEPL